MHLGNGIPTEGLVVKRPDLSANFSAIIDIFANFTLRKN